MRNAVIYARYSSEMQNEQSIEGQIYDCEAYAKRHGLVIVGMYADRAVSGKTENRPQFLKMIADSDKKLFDCVLVYKLDRFGRNKYDAVVYKKKLKDNGVKVISATENIPDTPEGIVLEGMLEAMAEYFSANLSQNTMRGMKQSALKCRFTGGYVTLGYKINEQKEYEIHDADAAKVRLIFEWYASGKSYSTIIKELNGRGWKTSVGKSFGTNSLNSILRNKKYIGLYEFNKDVVIEDGIPTIIDKEVFEAVQDRMAQNKKRSGRAKAKVEYYLSGKIFCGKCGGAMVGMSTTNSRSVTTNYYECNVKKRLKTCDKKNVRKDWIEKLVVEETMRILTDDLIAFIAKNVHAVHEKDRDNQGVIDDLQGQLKGVDVRIKNISKAIAEGILTATTKDMLLEAEQEKDVLKVCIEQEKIINKTVLTEEQIIYWISQFKGGDANNPDFCRRIINTFVNSVFVFDEKTVVTYNYSGDNNRVTIEHIKEALEKSGSGGSDIRGCAFPLVKSRLSGFYREPFFLFLHFFCTLGILHAKIYKQKAAISGRHLSITYLQTLLLVARRKHYMLSNATKPPFLYSSRPLRIIVFSSSVRSVSIISSLSSDSSNNNGLRAANLLSGISLM